MTEPNHQPTSSSNVDVVSGVGNSVVNDLMRVYESLTQSSTPQAEVSNASKALNLAYTISEAPDPTVARAHQPATEYPSHPSAFQQQQQGTTAKKSEAAERRIPPSLSKDGGGDDRNMTFYEQQQTMNSDHARTSTGAAAYIPVTDANKDISYHTQRSGEEPHKIARTYSVASRSSPVSSHSIQQPAADASSESDKSTSSRRLKSKRKQSQNDLVSAGDTGGGGKKGKKSRKEDGRWSKRFTWPEDLHRDFVSAIFDVGLKHSSPSAIMEHMPKHEQINSERIKSHLQKYRLHRVKSKKEFISSYEASLRNFQNRNHGGSSLVSGSAEVAAHLTASTLTNGNATTGMGIKKGANKNILNTGLNADSNQNQTLYNSQNGGNSNNDSLLLPQLTEAEKASPIGSAMGYLMGLFFSLKQQLMIQRSLEEAGEKAKGNVLFSSSATANLSSGGSNIATNNPTAAAVAVAAGVDIVSDSAMQQAQSQNGCGSTSMRSNIEENSKMKREMQNQMAIQNKMRALKQQELNKYKNINTGAAVASNAVIPSVVQHSTSHFPVAAAMDSNIVERNFVAGDWSNIQQTHQQEHPSIDGTRIEVSTQGAGEIAGTDMSARTLTTLHGQAKEGANNLLGIDSSEDFWNTDVVDDQLFEFLMNS